MVAGVILGWITYLMALPSLWTTSSALFGVAILTLGGYLATWLGYLRHEAYHGYFTPFRRVIYSLTSFVVFSDPAVFSRAHPTHHAWVHTTRDIEFFCAGHESDRSRRRVQFLAELLFGNAAWELSTLYRLRREGRWDRREGARNLLLRLLLLASLAALAVAIHGWSAAGPFLLGYGLTLWWGALVTRHNQWMEHLGIVSDGPRSERDMLTRNVPSTGWLNRLWNFYNHADPKEHVFHHIDPMTHGRGLDRDLPQGAVTLDVWDYPALLWAHIKSL